MNPLGESPSSSASDVDNLNNQAAMDKDTIDKVGGSHVAGNHIANAGSCTSFLWLLDSVSTHFFPNSNNLLSES